MDVLSEDQVDRGLVIKLSIGQQTCRRMQLMESLMDEIPIWNLYPCLSPPISDPSISRQRASIGDSEVV
ncbi:hypothetical protein Nepgr_026091 [Nepenthes gracilis]|uniref:Uncharacterized protein n=1 Tax=Nepenthes gracilis TaxID=150966 RepID=A0AAD3T7E8_NEPGR|nr:hypothetical protein Nepgr_026091 [Nepenthes gracilis]